MFVSVGVLSYCLLAGKDAAWALAAGALATLVAWIVRPQPGGFHIPELPQGQKQSTILRVMTLDSLAGDNLRFGLPVEKVRTLAVGLVAGEPLTQVRWQGLLTRAELAKVVSEFVRFGYARERSPGTPARGYVLTAQGRAVMRGLAVPPPHPAGTMVPKFLR